MFSRVSIDSRHLTEKNLQLKKKKTVTNEILLKNTVLKGY